MLFHTIEFTVLFFFLLPFALTQNSLIRRLALLLGSYIFYMWFNIYLVLLLVFSSLLDFVVGQAIYKSNNDNHRKVLLLFSLAGNLGMLFIFKYYNFSAGFLNSVFGILVSTTPIPIYDIILPIGISFYTFQTLSYTIDIYRGKLKPTNDLLTFALYVAFFPQLVAGPIVRASVLIPQLIRGPNFFTHQMRLGLGFFVVGLVKKVVIADNLAIFSDQIFNLPSAYSGIDVLLGVYAFAFQIYCDFSGYTDMARGIAYIIGYDIGINFNFPYFSTNIRDFWRRWHISLSYWLRDYLYISLGGNRCSKIKHYRNIMITMLLGGLWHGASWTFVLWGGIHGIWLIIDDIYRISPFHQRLSRWGGAPLSLFRSFLVFHGVCFAWIFFRANELSHAFEIIGNLPINSLEPTIGWTPIYYILPILCFDAIHLYTNMAERILRHHVAYWILIFTALFIAIIFGNQGGGNFVYFQF